MKLSRKVAIMDTSVMCCWLSVPGCETAGSPPDQWDYNRANQEIISTRNEGFNLIFPITTLLETGNHIAHGNHHRFEKATELVEVLRKASTGEEPWTPFSEQFATIGEEALGHLVVRWPEAAARGVSLGDFLITSVADYYSLAGYSVRIITSDTLLRQHVPAQPPSKPRRRPL